MWGAIGEFLSSDGGKWHGKLPFVMGFVFVVAEVIVRVVRGRRPVFHVPAIAYLFNEGIAVTIILVYGIALAFNERLAQEIAEKNSKVLAGAMLVAFATLAAHIFNRWFSKTSDHD